MQVLLGNATPKNSDGSLRADEDDPTAPAVTYVTIPEGDGGYDWDESIDPAEFKDHLVNAVFSRRGITSFPGAEALLAIVHPDAFWSTHSADDRPAWVSVPASPSLEAAIAHVWGIPAGIPDDVEDTHYTYAGAPGTHPNPGDDPTLPVPDMTANITQTGRDMAARNMGGGVIGAVGTSTGAGATTLTDSGATWSTNAFAGQRVSAGAAGSGVWGIVASNTGTVLTIDRWYAPLTPGGAAGTTPGATTGYVIFDGGPAAWFIGLTANASAPASPSVATTLTAEIVSAGGGLVRKIAPFAHTASTNTWTLTPVYTANGSDALPVTVAKIGVFSSMVVSATPTMLFETLLSSTATLSASGDQLTITETITTT